MKLIEMEKQLRKTKLSRKIKEVESEKASNKKLLAIDCGKILISR